MVDEFETFVEAAEIEGGVEFDGPGLEGRFTGKVGGDELANFGRDLGDMAGRAGGGGMLACLFQRLGFNKYIPIPVLGFSRGKYLLTA